MSTVDEIERDDTLSDGYKAGYKLLPYNNPYPEDSGNYYRFEVDYRDGYLYRKTVDNYPSLEPPQGWDKNLYQ